jgi:hypothetical protein
MDNTNTSKLLEELVYKMGNIISYNYYLIHLISIPTFLLCLFANYGIMAVLTMLSYSERFINLCQTHSHCPKLLVSGE